jgi:nucleoid-associated protein YgaU
MQQIERYGVIALVFFLITIVAVSFWGDSKSPGFWSRLTGHAKKDATADHILPPASSTDTALTPPAPLDQDPQRNLVADGGPAGAVQSAPQNDAQGAGFVAAPSDTLAPQPSAPLPAPAATNEYVVQKGDSLALIARRTLGKESRWSEIAALNPGLTPKNLKVGARLALPADATALAAPLPAPKKPEAAPKAKPAHVAMPEKQLASAHSCKVQKGDTLKAIARRELGGDERWKEIADLNPGISPGKLAVGQVLRLPERGRATEVASLVERPVSDKPRVR